MNTEDSTPEALGSQVVRSVRPLLVLLECREYGPVSETADAWHLARAPGGKG